MNIVLSKGEKILSPYYLLYKWLELNIGIVDATTTHEINGVIIDSMKNNYGL